MSGSAAQFTAWKFSRPRALSSWIIRDTTSLPEPVGPRISTEMSDLAAVRIHSNTISIFSSRPIISRKRCTDGDWSSVLIAARRSRNASSSWAIGARSGRLALKRPGASSRRRASPKSTSSFRQFSTSRRMRPNVAISDSMSKDSSGRAFRKRTNPARSGDCTRLRNRASV